jgi:hypothetical protein
VRYGQREVLWRESSLERVRKCGKVGVGGDGHVMIKSRDGVAHYAGLATCGSIWACPVCSAKIRNHRALDISAATAAWDSAGNSVYMATLTFPHDMGMRLKELLPVVANGFRSVISGSRWTKAKEQLGIVGTIRALEVTHGQSGWHPHLHVLVFIDHNLTASELARFAGHFRGQWATWITKAGYRLPHQQHGVQITRCASAEEAGQYIAKTQDGRSVGNELARSDMKSGRGGGRTPFEILDDFRWTGDLADLALYREYEQATRGRQAITWSKGLRAAVAVAPELTDEDIAAAEIGGEDLAVIHLDDWRNVVRIPGLTSYLLDQAESGGIAAVNAALDRHNLGRAMPPQATAAMQ